MPPRDVFALLCKLLPPLPVFVLVLQDKNANKEIIHVHLQPLIIEFRNYYSNKVNYLSSTASLATSLRIVVVSRQMFNGLCETRRIVVGTWFGYEE